MAQTGYVPISLYYSTTAATAPTAANLVSGELAINITDGILFYKDNAGVVQTLATKAATSGSYTSITLTGGTANGIAYLNGSKVLTTGTSMTYNGTDTWTFDGGTSTYILGASGEMLIGEDTNRFYFAGGFGVSPAIPIVYGNAGTTYQSWTIGSEQMRLTSTGLGIGTSSPAQKLHVASAGTTAIQVQNTASTGSAYLKSTNTATTCNFGVDATGGYIETLGAYGTLFYTNGSERMRLDSSGNLGIGTSSPAAKLEVNGNVNLTNQNQGYYINLYYSGGFKYSGNGYGYQCYGSTDGSWVWGNAGNNSSGAGAAATVTERMRLNTSGNLGIGTSSPSAKLHIRDGNTEDVSGSAIRMDLSGINPYWEIQGLNGGTSANRKLNFYTSAFGGLNVLTLTQAGGVGIGTSSPATKIEVRGAGATVAGITGVVGGVFENSANATTAPQGAITLGAAYTGTTPTVYAYVSGAKENTTDGNYAGALIFGSRPNGGNLTERARIDSSGNLLVGATTALSSVSGSSQVKVGEAGMQTTSQAIAASTATTIARSGSGGVAIVSGYNGTGQYSAIVLFKYGGTTTNVIGVLNDTGSTITYAISGVNLQVTSSLALTNLTVICLRPS